MPTVSTVAGAGVAGFNDGIGTVARFDHPHALAVDANGTNARFNNPEGIAVDTSGNVYVSDFLNHAIRKIAPNGDVTTLAGQLGAAGYVDGRDA